LEISGIPQIKEAEVNETKISLQIVLDFIGENLQLDDAIKQGINSMLSKIYSVSKYRDIVKGLNSHYMRALRSYTIDQKGKIKSEFQEIVEAEYVKRSSVANSSNPLSIAKNEPAIQPKVLKEPEEKSGTVETEMTNSQSKPSYLELVLYVVLAFVILAIIFLLIVGLSDALFKELWSFFKYIHK
jgi:hypothetical protein